MSVNITDIHSCFECKSICYKCFNRNLHSSGSGGKNNSVRIYDPDCLQCQWNDCNCQHQITYFNISNNRLSPSHNSRGNSSSNTIPSYNFIQDNIESGRDVLVYTTGIDSLTCF
jgi:hypothetical protein